MWNSGWDKIFKENDWGKYPDMSIVRYISRKFNNKNKRKKISILEVGCGTGANLSFFAKEGFRTYGIDGSKVAIKKATKKLKRDNLKADLIVSDIKKLPYRSSVFDCVVDCECLYSNSYSETILILKEINRVLKKKGFFLSKTFAKGTYGDGNGIKIPNEKNTYKSISKGAFRKGYGIIRISSLKDIKNLYGKSFKIENIEYSHRSIKGMKKIIKEWVISMIKKNNVT